jgi:D-alanine-D-alanine ligase
MSQKISGGVFFMKKVAVFFGGESVEHDISVITGIMTLNSLDKERYMPIPVYIGKDGGWYSGEQLFDLDAIKNLDLKKLDRVTLVGGENLLYKIKGKKLKPIASIAVAINCMHGERGEDGSLLGALVMSKIPFASPPMLASSVCMDKRFTKTVMKGLSVSVLPFVYAVSQEDLKKVNGKLNFPVIVKPNKAGSSIGISIAKDFEELKSAFIFARRYGEGVIIEEKLENFIEINCAGYLTEKGVKVSLLEQPVGRTNILSFSDKYEGGKRIFPAKLSKKLTEKIRGITKKVYLELGAEGIIRIDFFVVGEKVYLNEINTVPGSLAYYLFTQTLKGFSEILNELISVAEKKFAVGGSFLTEYHSGILSGFGSKGAKRL